MLAALLVLQLARNARARKEGAGSGDWLSAMILVVGMLAAVAVVLWPARPFP